MHVKATLSPDDLARACAEAMWKEDDASQRLGMKIVEVRSGQATLTMTVRPDMVNGLRIAHGAFIYALADSAFAFACNSHGRITVALDVSITFTKPVQSGERISVEANEIHLSNKIGVYDIRATNEKGELVAQFKGTAYRTSREVISMNE